MKRLLSYSRTLFLIALLLSIIVNVVLYARNRNRRTIFSLNGQSISKQQMDEYLEQQQGPDYMAMMIRRMLVADAAKTDQLAPTDTDVETQYEQRRELDYLFCRTLLMRPWLIDETREQIRQQIEENRLVTRGAQVTDAEIESEYRNNPALYDTPAKARCELAAIYHTDHIDSLQHLMELNVSETVMAQNYPRDVEFLGDNGVFTFTQPLGTNVNGTVFEMKPGAVKILGEPPADMLDLGARTAIVRLQQIIPGHRANLKDPETLDKIRLAVALRKSQPFEQYLYTLWKHSALVCDDPAQQKFVASVLFPDIADANP